MRELRFFKNKFRDILFDKCELIRIENISTSLKDIDFSSCLLVGGTFSISDLKGIILNSEQAIEISKILGIQIKD